MPDAVGYAASLSISKAVLLGPKVEVCGRCSPATRARSRLGCGQKRRLDGNPNVVYNGRKDRRNPMYVADAKRLTAAGAKAIMATALARAQEAGVAVTIAIVDAGGHLVLLERMDGGRFHTVHSATTKAVCAASTRRATGAKGAQGQALDAAHALGLSL